MVAKRKHRVADVLLADQKQPRWLKTHINMAYVLLFLKKWHLYNVMDIALNPCRGFFLGESGFWPINLKIYRKKNLNFYKSYLSSPI